MYFTQVASYPEGPLFDPSRTASSRIVGRRDLVVRDGFAVFPVFKRLSVRGGPTEGGTLVGLVGEGMDAFNFDNQAAIRCRWGQDGLEAAGVVAPEVAGSNVEGG